MELANKSVIITGASSGIGAAAAQLFASEGAKLVLTARRAEHLNQLRSEIVAKGGHVEIVVGDVTDPDLAPNLVDAALVSFGRLDGAFNNAGLVGDMRPVADMSLDTWREVIDVNLTSAFLLAKAQIPALTDGGALVFTSSFVGVSNGGMPGMGAYAAAKAGLVGLVRSLARDHGADGIRVNALLPGGTLTPMAGDDLAVHDTIAGLHPLGRLASPTEIAETALFLLSDRASFVTGAPILADGGVSVRFG